LQTLQRDPGTDDHQKNDRESGKRDSPRDGVLQEHPKVIEKDNAPDNQSYFQAFDRPHSPKMALLARFYLRLFPSRAPQEKRSECDREDKQAQRGYGYPSRDQATRMCLHVQKEATAGA
jgi:hypothetical protein